MILRTYVFVADAALCEGWQAGPVLQITARDLVLMQTSPHCPSAVDYGGSQRQFEVNQQTLLTTSVIKRPTQPI